MGWDEQKKMVQPVDYWMQLHGMRLIMFHFISTYFKQSKKWTYYDLVSFNLTPFYICLFNNMSW